MDEHHPMEGIEPVARCCRPDRFAHLGGRRELEADTDRGGQHQPPTSSYTASSTLGFTNGVGAMHAIALWSYATPTTSSWASRTRRMQRRCSWPSRRGWPDSAWRSIRENAADRVRPRPSRVSGAASEGPRPSPFSASPTAGGGPGTAVHREAQDGRETPDNRFKRLWHAVADTFAFSADVSRLLF